MKQEIISSTYKIIKEYNNQNHILFRSHSVPIAMIHVEHGIVINVFYTSPL